MYARTPGWSYTRFLDADLQHPPTLLAQMLPLLDGGAQQVVARRTRDSDPPIPQHR